MGIYVYTNIVYIGSVKNFRFRYKRAIDLESVVIEIEITGKQTVTTTDNSPPPGKHLRIFHGNKKTQVVASFATNGYTARVKIAPLSR